MKHLIFFLACLLFLSSSDSPAQNAWRPFSIESPWNQKIASNARLDSQSTQLIDDLAKGDFNINIVDWSIPVYYINSDTVPKVNVINSRPGIYGRGYGEPNHIPILPYFIASPPVGDFSDNHMSIIDTTKMIEWGMWATRKDKDGNWTTGLGAMTDVRGTGVEKPWFEQEHEFDAHRARAGGFPLIAGLIRPEEIRAGKIEHALVFAYQRGRSEFFVPPASTAQATFMEMNNRVGIPMGGRIQLDPSINVDTLNLTPACRIIARALQEYGAFNGDYAGATVIYADNSPRALQLWKGVLKSEDFREVFTPVFVRRNFRVIEIGNLLPGQNLDSGRIGFVEFSFPGAKSTSIDWLTRTITCIASRGADLTHATPVFKTAAKNSSIFRGERKQASGQSVVDLWKPVKYRIDVPGTGSAVWTVMVVAR